MKAGDGKRLTLENWSVFKDDIRRALDAGAEPIAAFDADGTLWDTDIGENFFKFQARNKLVDLPEDPWEYYDRWHKVDAIPAYLWLAQINAGKPLAEVRAWAAQAVEEYSRHGGVPIFPHMRDLIGFLKTEGVRVLVVTASVKWAVEPAAALLDIPHEDVVGIVTAVDRDGIVGRDAGGPVTWREGKVDGLMGRTHGAKPFLAAGNTMGDFFLIQQATHVPFAHTASPLSSGIHATERELISEAIKRGWYYLDLV